MALTVFPGVPTLMVEAQDGKKPHLERICRDFPNVSYVSALLGGTAGERVTFYEMETGSSFLPEQSNVDRTERTMTMQRLDDVAGHIEGPLFLKIDVQGAELQVLAGGQETLSRAAVVQLELAMLPYNKGAPTILEALDYMNARGLVPYDISGQTRVKRNDLVQIDMLFVPRDSRLRSDFFIF
jgi:FkbM family methyltransferase